MARVIPRCLDKRNYLRQAAKDPMLPAYRSRDDSPRRPLREAYSSGSTR